MNNDLQFYSRVLANEIYIYIFMHQSWMGRHSTVYEILLHFINSIAAVNRFYSLENYISIKINAKMNI